MLGREMHKKSEKTNNKGYATNLASAVVVLDAVCLLAAAGAGRISRVCELNENIRHDESERCAQPRIPAAK